MVNRNISVTICFPKTCADIFLPRLWYSATHQWIKYLWQYASLRTHSADQSSGYPVFTILQPQDTLFYFTLLVKHPQNKPPLSRPKNNTSLLWCSFLRLHLLCLYPGKHKHIAVNNFLHGSGIRWMGRLTTSTILGPDEVDQLVTAQLPRQRPLTVWKALRTFETTSSPNCLKAKRRKRLLLKFYGSIRELKIVSLGLYSP